MIVNYTGDTSPTVNRDLSKLLLCNTLDKSFRENQLISLNWWQRLIFILNLE